MKLIVLLAALTAVFLYHVDSAAVKLLPPSDLEVGTIGPDDTLLLLINEYYEPTPGETLIKASANVTLDRVRISYIKTEHRGNYPDARVELTDGGPGFTFFNYTIYPGPLGGYNYTTICYGVDLKNKTEYTIEQHSTKIFY